MEYVSIEEVRTAASALPPVVRRTPLWPYASDPSQFGRECLFLKLENLQAIGAYKVRAAFTMVSALTPEQRSRGIVLASSGNFAQAFALAGTYHGVRTRVVMLASTSPFKIEAARSLGAEVELFDGPALGRQPRVEALGRKHGMTVIDTWEERAIIAGHGTLGLEILEDRSDIEQILVPVSSGGMAAGVAAAVKQIAPQVRVIGVQPVGANAAYLSLAAGHPVSIDHWNTIADGLSARRPGEYPFAHLQRYLDEIVLVEERDIAIAHMQLRRRAKIIAEPAGAVSVAAYLSGRVDVNRRTVAVVSGGNLSDETFRALELLAKAG
ncbi:MAG TPA: threonine/serine dehydratase [Steroidobacteraceae bacterium]|nr:threonine/serine dehydratase [Steroidobacteraceae bacterium]